MTTLQLIDWYNISKYVFAFIAFGIFLFIAAYAVAKAQKRSFDIKFKSLKDLINNAPVDKENYQAIYDLFTYDMYCYSDDDKDKVLHLWHQFKNKFKEFFPEDNKSKTNESI